MSDLKPIAYISCNLTNRDSVVLTNQNGIVLTGADPDDYTVIGYYHSEGAEECDDWMHWNKELVDRLNSEILQTLDTAIAPAASPLTQDEAPDGVPEAVFQDEESGTELIADDASFGEEVVEGFEGFLDDLVADPDGDETLED